MEGWKIQNANGFLWLMECNSWCYGSAFNLFTWTSFPISHISKCAVFPRCVAPPILTASMTKSIYPIIDGSDYQSWSFLSPTYSFPHLSLSFPLLEEALRSILIKYNIGHLSYYLFLELVVKCFCEAPGVNLLHCWLHSHGIWHIWI